MEAKKALIENSEKLSKITNHGFKAVERVSLAIEKNNTESLNFDAEKVLAKDIIATVNSIKTEILAYRVIHNKLS